MLFLLIHRNHAWSFLSRFLRVSCGSFHFSLILGASVGLTYLGSCIFSLELANLTLEESYQLFISLSLAGQLPGKEVDRLTGLEVWVSILELPGCILGKPGQLDVDLLPLSCDGGVE